MGGRGAGVELEMSCHSISVYFLRPSTEYSNSKCNPTGLQHQGQSKKTTMLNAILKYCTELTICLNIKTPNYCRSTSRLLL